MLERTLIFWLLGFSSLAYFWPAIDSGLPAWMAGLGDPFQATSGTSMSALIAVTMFSIGWILPRNEIRQVVQRWPTVLGGTCIQYTAMPLLAYGMASLFGLSSDDFVGIVIVGCVPGAMASNVLTMNARGNTSYSVSLTTASTLLSPLAVPLLIAASLSTSQQAAIPLWKTSRILLLTVVGPVVAGHLLSRRFPDWERQARRCGSTIANLAILWIIAAVVGRTREELTQFHVHLFWALLGVNLGGYLCGYAGGAILRLPGGMRRALTLEVGMQNAGLGATLATQLFPDQRAVAIAPAMYTFGCMLTGTLLARGWVMLADRSAVNSRESSDQSPSHVPDHGAGAESG